MVSKTKKKRGIIGGSPSQKRKPRNTSQKKQNKNNLKEKELYELKLLKEKFESEWLKKKLKSEWLQKKTKLELLNEKINTDLFHDVEPSPVSSSKPPAPPSSPPKPPAPPSSPQKPPAPPSSPASSPSPASSQFNSANSSPKLEFEYENETNVPYTWRNIPSLLNTKLYVNNLGIPKTEIKKSTNTNVGSITKISRDILISAAESKHKSNNIEKYDKMSNEEIHNLIKPKNILIQKSYTYDFITCNAIKQNIPTYKVSSTVAEGKTNINGTDYYLDEACFPEFNITLCKTFILLGIISKYLWKDTNCDYFILIKGGKAVQLLLKNTQPKDTKDYDSHDIDISIFPKKGIEYNKESAHKIALHVGYLIKWFMSNPNIIFEPKQQTEEVNVIDENIDENIDEIIKNAIEKDVEYLPVEKLYCCASKYAFCDIDYGEQKSDFFNPDMLEHFEMDYKNLNSYTMEFDSLYISSNLDMTLKEKCFNFTTAFIDKPKNTKILEKFVKEPAIDAAITIMKTKINEHKIKKIKYDLSETEQKIQDTISIMKKKIRYAEFRMGKNKKAIVRLADSTSVSEYITDERMIKYLYDEQN